MMHKQHAILQYSNLGPYDAVLTKVVYIYIRIIVPTMPWCSRMVESCTWYYYGTHYRTLESVAQINLLCRSPLQFVLFETRRRNGEIHNGLWFMIESVQSLKMYGYIHRTDFPHSVTPRPRKRRRLVLDSRDWQKFRFLFPNPRLHFKF